MPEYTEEQQEQIRKYRELFNAKKELHKLMRRVVVSTKLGRQERQPDDDIELEIGNGSLGSCGRYAQVRYYPANFSGEYELDNDIGSINYLLEEIKKRFQEFRKARDSRKVEYVNSKKQFARKFFSSTLSKIEKEYSN